MPKQKQPPGQPTPGADGPKTTPADKKEDKKPDESLQEIKGWGQGIGLDLGKGLAEDVFDDIVHGRNIKDSFLKVFRLAPEELFKKGWEESLKKANEEGPLEGFAHYDRLARQPTSRHVTLGEAMSEPPINDFTNDPHRYLHYSDRELDPLLEKDLERSDARTAGDNLTLIFPMPPHDGTDFKVSPSGIKFNPKVDIQKLAHFGNPNRYLTELDLGAGVKVDWKPLETLRIVAKVEGEGGYKAEKDSKHWPPTLTELKKEGSGAMSGEVQLDFKPNDRFIFSADFSGKLDSSGKGEGRASLQLQIFLDPDYDLKARRYEWLTKRLKEIEQEPPRDK
jgi:hypothetical protein